MKKKLKLYHVEVVVDLVVAAETVVDARCWAEEWDNLNEVLGPGMDAYEVNASPLNIDELPNKWDSFCLPWNGDDDHTISDYGDDGLEVCSKRGHREE